MNNIEMALIFFSITTAMDTQFYKIFISPVLKLNYYRVLRRSTNERDD